MKTLGLTFTKLIQHDSKAVRLAACIALRKRLTSTLADPWEMMRPTTEFSRQQLSALLEDDDLSIVLEAARAIHDLPPNSSVAALSYMLEQIDKYHGSDPLVRRILNANFRFSTFRSAKALANYTINPKADDERRLEVIQWFAEWENPPARDKVLHAWAPLDRRDARDAQRVFLEVFGQLTQDSDEIAAAAIETAGALGLDTIGPELLALSKSTTAKTSTRIAALKGLDKLQNSELPKALDSLAAEPNKLDSSLLTVVAALTAKRDEATAMPLLKSALERDEPSVKQSAIATLGTMTNDASSKILAGAIQKMTADKYPETLRLDCHHGS